MAISTKPPTGKRTVNPSDTSEVFPPSILQDAKSRPERARAYEEKTAVILSFLTRICAGNESTVADAAAFIELGPSFASKMGDLAHHDARVRKGIDLITQGSDNPYLALALASLPLLSQIVRNHETEAAKPITIRIPFTKRRFSPKIRIRLKTPFFRSLTSTPSKLIDKVFGNPEIKASLIANGIDVALPGYREAGNGHRS